MLLPPDLRDWVPQDDMVHFVIEAVSGMPRGDFKVNRRSESNRRVTRGPRWTRTGRN